MSEKGKEGVSVGEEVEDSLVNIVGEEVIVDEDALNALRDRLDGYRQDYQKAPDS